MNGLRHRLGMWLLRAEHYGWLTRRHGVVRDHLARYYEIMGEVFVVLDASAEDDTGKEHNEQ